MFWGHTAAGWEAMGTWAACGLTAIAAVFAWLAYKSTRGQLDAVEKEVEAVRAAHREEMEQLSR